MNLRKRANSGPSTGFVTSGRPMWSTTTVVGRRGEEVDQLRQVRRLEIDDDMPVVLDDAAGDLDQLVLRREVDQPLDEIEPDAAHAGLMKPLEFGVGDARV